MSGGIEKGREKEMKEVNKLKREGVNLAKKGNFEGSLRIFEEALKASPGNFAILNNMAWSYWEMRKLEEAMLFAKKALVVNNTDIRPMKVMLNIFIEKEFWHDAIAMVNNIMKQTLSISSITNYLYAIALAHTQRFEEALEIVDHIEDLSTNIKMLQAYCLMSTGKLDACKVVLDEVIKDKAVPEKYRNAAVENMKILKEGMRLAK
jgi:tetratricopeptide (TPR) repeat protein